MQLQSGCKIGSALESVTLLQCAMCGSSIPLRLLLWIVGAAVSTTQGIPDTCACLFFMLLLFFCVLQNDYSLLFFYMMITLAAITEVSQWPRLFSEQTVSLQTVGMRLQKSERENSNFSEFVFV